MGKGYIKLHREIQDCWIWKDERFTRGQAWVDLLLLANHKDVKIAIGENIEIVKRGQFVTSIAKLSDRWKWSFNTTKKFLNLLENDNMLTRKSDNSKTLITIVNYGIYQADEREKTENLDRPIDRPLDRPIDRPADRQSANPLTDLLTDRVTDRVTDTLIPNNNEEEYIKNEKKNIYSVHFEAFWKAYPRKKEKSKAYKCYQARLKDGFSEDELLIAAQKYAEECKREHREERYIKLGATFLSSNTPFVDYLKGGENNAGHANSDKEHEKWVEEHREQLDAVRRDLFGV